MKSDFIQSLTRSMNPFMSNGEKDEIFIPHLLNFQILFISQQE